MLPLLTVLADFFGLIGGWLVSFNILKLNTALYWSTAFRSLNYNNALEGLVKPVVFGFIVGTVGCYFGSANPGRDPRSRTEYDSGRGHGVDSRDRCGLLPEQTYY